MPKTITVSEYDLTDPKWINEHAPECPDFFYRGEAIAGFKNGGFLQMVHGSLWGRPLGSDRYGVVFGSIVMPKYTDEFLKACTNLTRIEWTKRHLPPPGTKGFIQVKQFGEWREAVMGYHNQISSAFAGNQKTEDLIWFRFRRYKPEPTRLH